MKVYAQDLTLPDGSKISGPKGLAIGTKIGDIVSNMMPYIFLFAGIGLFLMLLSGGFKFMTSAGDPKKMESGKQQITWGLVGFIIVFTSYWIVQIFQIMFGNTFTF